MPFPYLTPASHHLPLQHQPEPTTPRAIHIHMAIPHSDYLPPLARTECCVNTTTLCLMLAANHLLRDKIPYFKRIESARDQPGVVNMSIECQSGRRQMPSLFHQREKPKKPQCRWSATRNARSATSRRWCLSLPSVRSLCRSRSNFVHSQFIIFYSRERAAGNTPGAIFTRRWFGCGELFATPIPQW